MDLIDRVELIEQELGLAPTTILLDDDFEDGLDPAWVHVNGTTQTIAPTSDCTQAYWSRYGSGGSLGLHFDEVERYDYELPVPSLSISTMIQQILPQLPGSVSSHLETRRGSG